MLGLRRRTSQADRQTFIALRATRTAVRVARDVAYPKLPAEPKSIFSTRAITDWDRPDGATPFYGWARDDFVRMHPFISLAMLAAGIAGPFAVYYLLLR
jgi:hypothetical protein